MNCAYCGDEVKHPEDHKDLCCDCFDLSCGMPLDQLNEERAARGVGPLESIKYRRGEADGRMGHPPAEVTDEYLRGYRVGVESR